MERLIEILASKGVQVTEAEIKPFITGLDLEAATLAQTKAIADEITSKLSGALSTATPTKKGMLKKAHDNKLERGNKTKQQGNTTSQLSGNIARELKKEKEAIFEQVTQSVENYAIDGAAELLDIVGSSNALMLKHFGSMAQEFEGNPELFQSATKGITDTIFSIA